MRVFLTGATGFIGSQILPELIASGHEVLGMARSDAGARRLEASGATAHVATLEDPDSVARGADDADAVIHTAFDHDFSRYVENCEKDARVIAAIARALGRDRPLIITSGTAMGSPGTGEPAREDVLNLDPMSPRSASERAAVKAAERGASVAAVRLPQVHDTERQGFVSFYIQAARQAGVCAFVGDGANRWPAAHVDDVARLYRLALEQHQPGARWHAVAEEGVPMRDVAEIVGAGLGLPVRSVSVEEAPQYLGWLAGFAAQDMVASSAWTRQRLGWEPTGPALIADLQAMDYRAPATA